MNERDPRSLKVTPRVTFREPEKVIMEMHPTSASKTRRLLDVGSSENSGESSVSTELCLYDETWPCENPDKRKMSRNDPEGSRGSKENSNTELERMRMISNEEKEEEERYGVSTGLTLFADPWTIKKALTTNDLSHLNSLFLNVSTVENHILKYLHENDQRKVHGSGLTVNVFDHDTHSMHKMLLKIWSKSQIYALNAGWRMNFVRIRSLKNEDEIGMYWDPSDSKLHFRLLSRAPTPSVCSVSGAA